MCPFLCISDGFLHTVIPAGVCPEGEVRLVNGTDETTGLVEVCVNAKFGKVCKSSWSDEDAMVVCASLGFPATGIYTCPPLKIIQTLFCQ